MRGVVLTFTVPDGRIQESVEVVIVKNLKSRLNKWYWRAAYVGLTVGSVIAAAAAPPNWN